MRNLGFTYYIPKQGYRILRQISGNPVYEHFFCGLPVSKKAISPFTGKPLLRFLSLDTRDPRLELQLANSPKIELLYSWTCGIADGDFFYKLHGDEIEILHPGNNGAFSEADYTDFPYADYPLSFPEISVDLVAVDDNERSIVKRINEVHNLDLELQYPDLSESYHQTCD